MAIEVDYKGFLKALGAHIKDLRKQRKWSNRHMLVVHGFNDSQWRKYERGGGLTVESLLRIAAVFEVSLSNLLDGLAEYPAKPLPEVVTKNETTSVLKKRATKHH